MAQQEFADTRSVQYASDGSASALQIRLDINPLLIKIEAFLKGNQLLPRQRENGEIYYVRVKTGDPLCNAKGQHMILNKINSIINEHTVQGNFEKLDQLHNWMVNFNRSIARMIVYNWYDWGLDSSYWHYLQDYIDDMTYPFMSRLLYNKERDSYGDIFRENTHVMGKKPILKAFGSG